MTYFKINGYDYSRCVNQLNIQKVANYTTQMNAAGNSVVEYINSKRTITVGIIPLTADDVENLHTALADKGSIEMDIQFLNPETNSIDEAHCILPDTAISYYTIQADKVLLNAFTLVFTEL